jgi:hypothetical protein
MTSTIPIRVMVLDAWDQIPLSPTGQTTIADLKRQALGAARVPDDPAGFVVKFRGGELRDESRTLAAEAIPPGAQLIVLRRHRRPVR